MQLSLYKNKESKENKVISLENYVDIVKNGYLTQDAVINARAIKQKMLEENNPELEKKYKRIKDAAQVVTPSGTIPNGMPKTAGNVKKNGLICLDIDEDLNENQIHSLSTDEYTKVLHRSFTTGYCVWYEINPEKFDNAYESISKYLYNTYYIKTDPSGKNVNRLRFCSYDPDIIYNTKVKKFPVKVKKKEKAIPNFLHTNESFDHILTQIKERSIDLCNEDYHNYMRIGMSIASEFGESGRHNYHEICRMGMKYKEKDTDRDYNGFVRATSNNSDITIGTFYYLCKEAGIELYSPKTKEIINRVKVSKSQGTPTVEGIKANTETLGYTVTSEDEELIKKLIDSNEDYSNIINEDLSDIEILGNFIRDVYEPSKDEITKYKYVNGKRLNDSLVDDIYITCKKEFREMTVSKEDIRTVINSSLYVKLYNHLKDFLNEYENIETNNAIERVVECIETTEDVNREYVKWAFTRWLVSGLHNWTCDEYDPIVSPLTFVLCSSRMGSGKTFFYRTLMPKELRDYYVEGKIDVLNKDAKLRLARSLMMLDDEFGGKSVKEAEQFKSVTDSNEITERVPYGREDEVFKRRTLLCGTSNTYNLLKDFSGKNRRILPINIKCINHDKFQAIDKKELIIEAYNLLKSGFDWKIYKEEDVDYLYQNTQDNIDVLPIEDIFKQYFRFEPEGDYQHKVVRNQGQLMEFFKKYTVFKETSKYDIKAILDKNGISMQKTYWDAKQDKNVKGYQFFCKLSSEYNFPLDVPHPEFLPTESDEEYPF